jgi:2'-hydroxyisoflavone reductase
MATSLSRRTFLAGSAAAASSVSLPWSASQMSTLLRSKQPKRILMLGGTGWLGPAVVRAGLARGHHFTLFNRGRSNPKLFADVPDQVTKLVGQRRRPKGPETPKQDLSALAKGEWDAVVDTSAYFTREVEDVAALLKGRVGQYVFVSSLSVYPALGETNEAINEESALATCEDQYTTDMGKEYERYGALKRYCEDAAEAVFTGATTRVRPGYIVGPGDATDRFSYWPKRFLRGGEILAPGSRDNDLQFIDVRDLGQWLVHLIENGTVGPFNAVGFDGSISMEEFLFTGKGTVNHKSQFTWVDDEFLLANKVSSWGEMGCWTPKKSNGHCHNDRAIAAGLTFRPIADTIRDTAHWIQNERGDRPWQAGMAATREAELLKAWKNR